jgi:hypothetical protein
MVMNAEARLPPGRRASRRLALPILAAALALMAPEALTPSSLAGEPNSPGKLISAEAMPSAPKGARAYLIRYWSTGLDGKPAEVSGVVIAPSGSPPPGGRDRGQRQRLRIVGSGRSGAPAGRFPAQAARRGGKARSGGRALCHQQCGRSDAGRADDRSAPSAASGRDAANSRAPPIAPSCDARHRLAFNFVVLLVSLMANSRAGDREGGGRSAPQLGRTRPESRSTMTFLTEQGGPSLETDIRTRSASGSSAAIC